MEKGRLEAFSAPVLYLTGIGLSFVKEWLAGLLYVAVAVMWFIPDRRLARAIDPRQK
jgi:hypothetical protein